MTAGLSHQTEGAEDGQTLDVGQAQLHQGGLRQLEDLRRRGRGLPQQLLAQRRGEQEGRVGQRSDWRGVQSGRGLQRGRGRGDGRGYRRDRDLEWCREEEAKRTFLGQQYDIYVSLLLLLLF